MTAVCELMNQADAGRNAHERGATEERRRIARDMHDDIGARLLMLRPERLRVLGATEEPGPGFNLLQATLLHTVYQGDSSLLQVALTDGTRLQVRSASIGLAAAAQIAPGMPLRLALAVHDTVLLAADGAAV